VKRFPRFRENFFPGISPGEGIPALIFHLSFYFPYFLLDCPFSLLNLAFDLFRFVAGQFPVSFTNLAFDFFSFSLYFIFVHVGEIHSGADKGEYHSSTKVITTSTVHQTPTVP